MELLLTTCRVNSLRKLPSSFFFHDKYCLNQAIYDSKLIIVSAARTHLDVVRDEARSLFAYELLDQRIRHVHA